MCQSSPLFPSFAAKFCVLVSHISPFLLPRCPPRKKYSSTPPSYKHRTRPIIMSTSSTRRSVAASAVSLAVAHHYLCPLQLTKNPALNAFEERTQIPKAYAVLGGVVLLTLFHFINSLAGPVSNLVGWALPAFLSFKALETPGHQDDVQWLTYWIVFGFFNFTESFALRLVLYYFPWYFAFKTIFIIWLQLPTFRVSPQSGCVSHVLTCV